MNVQIEQPTQQSQCLKALTTKAIHKSFVNHIFEVPTAATQCLIDNGLPPDHINDYFYLAFSSMKETKLIMFQYKISHDIVSLRKNCSELISPIAISVIFARKQKKI